MNDLLRQKLCDIVAAQGAAVADDPPRCAELLHQAAPEDGDGVEALVRALRARVPARLALLTEPLALAPLTSGLVRRLVDEQGLSEEAARWAVESWAFALGKGGDDAATLPGQFPAYEHVLASPRRRWRFVWYLLPALVVLAGLGAWWWLGQRSEVLRIADRTDGITCLALSADGRTVLAGCGDRSLRLWDVATGAELKRFNGHEGTPFDVALSPDGQIALSCGGSVTQREGKLAPVDCVLRAWDVETGEPHKPPFPPFGESPQPIYCVNISPDGRMALAGGGGYEYKEKEAEWVIKDKKLVPKECVVRLYDLETGQELRKLEGHKEPVWCAAFTPDGKRVVSGGTDGTVRLWDVASGHELKRTELAGKARIVSLAISPDGRRLLTGDDQARLALWDLENLEIESEYKRSTQAIHGVAFSPDGRRAVSGGDDFIVRLWDAETLTELRHYPGHTLGVMDVAFLPDGRHVLSGSYDGTIRVWRLP